MVVRVLADQTILRMAAFVKFVSDEGGRLETAEATMLSREKFDPVRVGHCEEVVTLTNVMLLHVERVCTKHLIFGIKRGALGILRATDMSSLKIPTSAPAISLR